MSVLLGLRMTFVGRRRSLPGLVLTAVGVAAGVMLLLFGLAGQSALQGRLERSAWQDTEASTEATAPDPALWLAVSDHYADRPLHRVHVAALGPRPPVPPGLDRLPSAGEVAVSPALRDLLAATPDDQLDDRIPGRVTMTIGDAGLRHPDHLVAVVGHTPEELRRLGGAQVVHGIETQSLDLIEFLKAGLMMATILMLVPILIFMIMVARLAGARHEQRLAAMRMVGATRLQTAAMAAAETGLSAVAGTIAGSLGYLAVRPILANIVEYGGYQGGRFFPADLVVPLDQLIVVLAGVPVLATLTTLLSLRRVQITPLRVGSRVPRKPPTAWRALPLAVGVAGFVVDTVVLRIRPDLMAANDWVINVLLLCTLAGAVTIGPWACLVVGRAMVRYCRRATTLIAARRIAGDPRAAYRSVGGVALAVFVTTLMASFFGIGSAGATPGASSDLRLRPGVVEIYAGGRPATVLAPLMSSGVVVTRAVPGGGIAVTCAELARVVRVSCPLALGSGTELQMPSTAAMGMWASGGAVVEPGSDAAGLPVHALYVQTDGSVAAEERVRTQASALLPRAIVSTSRDVFRQTIEFHVFSDIGTGMRIAMLFVLLVAGCSLTISLIGGLAERRRPFALLRAAGLGLGELRRIALLETAVPLVFMVLLAAGLASVPPFAISIIAAQPYAAPGWDFAALLGGGVLAALAMTTLTLPLIDSATRHDAVRFE
ncbi:FtsX-like permease family protein [Nonomuraea sp. NPDC050153]|uniref:FtsX-like permease family protein n=1 Tax=Nonomuraea sp. NPDC050153 TaxID=3364359 RepID=UPI00379570F6